MIHNYHHYFHMQVHFHTHTHTKTELKQLSEVICHKIMVPLLQRITYVPNWISALEVRLLGNVADFNVISTFADFFFAGKTVSKFLPTSPGSGVSPS